MQVIIDAIENKQLSAVISVVISNKKEAFALERARKKNIEAVFIDSKGKEREDFDKEVSEILEKNNVDLILLIGYMRILSSWFVNKWRNLVMNIHPSLLPAFAGGMDKNVHEEVLKAGVEVTGCTLHFVDETVDGGPIIMQKEVEVEFGETVDSLKEKVQKAEGEVFVEALNLYSEGKIKVHGDKVKILE